MALIDKASLLMVPSTYEAGKLYNVLPSGNRAPDNKGGAGYDQTRADFDFDRGSNAAATRIGSDGLLKKYRENLLTESNNFSDSDWSSLNSPTLTSGQADKDGGTNAWKFSATSSGSDRAIYQNTTGLNIVVTSSFYAKKGSVDFIYLASTRASSSQAQWFDLASGTLGTKLGSDIIASNIESVGNGWYRCSVTSAPYTAGYSFIALVDGDNSQTSSNGDFVYIQNAQLESGLVSTDYLESTSVTGKAGVLVDLPRINYDANGENGALLLEPSRQQLIQYSEYFEDSSWTKTSLNITTNATTSPSGFLDANKLVPTATSGQHKIDITKSVSSGANVALSAFVKKGEYQYCCLYEVTSAKGRFFDLSNGTKGATFGTAPTTSDIEPMQNDWYRIHITTSVPSTSARFILYVCESISSTSFTGNGSNGIYAYGAMLEQNATYPSSYIPNHGESGGVTRAADVCENGGSAESINSTEGVLFAEISALADDGTLRMLNINDGTKNNRVGLQYSSTTNLITAAYDISGAGQATISYTLSDANSFNKIAFKYKQNDFALWVNGVEVGTDTSGNVLPSNTLNNIESQYGDDRFYFYGNVKQVAVFNEALSDSELATLTTL
jgi:hypothetical protein